MAKHNLFLSASVALKRSYFSVKESFYSKKQGGCNPRKKLRSELAGQIPGYPLTAVKDWKSNMDLQRALDSRRPFVPVLPWYRGQAYKV